MTQAERNARIVKAIEAYTKRGLRSKRAAREMLISEGIYTRAGNLKKEFGGRGASAARVRPVRTEAAPD